MHLERSTVSVFVLFISASDVQFGTLDMLSRALVELPTSVRINRLEPMSHRNITLQDYEILVKVLEDSSWTEE